MKYGRKSQLADYQRQLNKQQNPVSHPYFIISSAPMDIKNLLIMIVVGVIAGSIAARIVKRGQFNFLISALLGIAGAVVGGYLFDLLDLTPGKHITQMLTKTFGVEFPENFIGMLVSATVGSIIILLISNFFQRGRRRDKR